jgi:hypothetical protein
LYVLVLPGRAEFPLNLISSCSNFRSLLVKSWVRRLMLISFCFTDFILLVFLVSRTGRSDLVFLLLGALPFASLRSSYSARLPQSALARFTARDFTCSPERPLFLRCLQTCAPVVLALCSSVRVQHLFFLVAGVVRCPASIFFTAAGASHFSFSILEPRLHLSIALQSCVNPVQRGQLL